MKNDDFYNWLISEVGLKKRSARDVRSRLKRVEKFCKLKKKGNAGNIIKDLSANKRFNQLELSVKSQLRRAVKLYYLYKYKR